MCQTPNMPSRRGEQGAALVTVLLLVGIMSVAAVASFEAIGFSIKRTTSSRLYDQARLYAMGGEHIARIAAERVVETDQALLGVIGFDGVNEISYPIADGLIEGTIEDTSNCFNVNSLVDTGDTGVAVGNPQTIEQYQYLLELSGLSEGEAEQLTATLVDWLDSDSRQSPRGAEDYDYAAFSPPYRAANTIMADLTELRLVSGYSTGVLTVLTSFLCALPSHAPATLNVNSLRSSDAVLLTALVGRAFSLPQIQGLIAERSARGYEAVGDFWRESVFDGRAVPQVVRAATDVKPSKFSAQVHVRYHEADVYLLSDLLIGSDGKALVLNRSFGAVP